MGIGRINKWHLCMQFKCIRLYHRSTQTNIIFPLLAASVHCQITFVEGMQPMEKYFPPAARPLV